MAIRRRVAFLAITLLAAGNIRCETSADLAPAIDLILSRSYSGQDTSALLSKIQDKMKWGEKDERLIEAEAILLWDRGEWRSALIGLQRLSQPGARAMAM